MLLSHFHSLLILGHPGIRPVSRVGCANLCCLPTALEALGAGGASMQVYPKYPSNVVKYDIHTSDKKGQA